MNLKELKRLESSLNDLEKEIISSNDLPVNNRVLLQKQAKELRNSFYTANLNVVIYNTSSKNLFSQLFLRDITYENIFIPSRNSNETIKDLINKYNNLTKITNKIFSNHFTSNKIRALPLDIDFFESGLLDNLSFVDLKESNDINFSRIIEAAYILTFSDIVITLKNSKNLNLLINNNDYFKSSNNILTLETEKIKDDFKERKIKIFKKQLKNKKDILNYLTAEESAMIKAQYKKIVDKAYTKYKADYIYKEAISAKKDEKDKSDKKMKTLKEFKADYLYNVSYLSNDIISIENMILNHLNKQYMKALRIKQKIFNDNYFFIKNNINLDINDLVQTRDKIVEQMDLFTEDLKKLINEEKIIIVDRIFYFISHIQDIKEEDALVKTEGRLSKIFSIFKRPSKVNPNILKLEKIREKLILFMDDIMILLSKIISKIYNKFNENDSKIVDCFSIITKSLPVFDNDLESFKILTLKLYSIFGNKSFSFESPTPFYLVASYSSLLIGIGSMFTNITQKISEKIFFGALISLIGGFFSYLLLRKYKTNNKIYEIETLSLITFLTDIVNNINSIDKFIDDYVITYSNERLRMIDQLLGIKK